MTTIDEEDDTGTCGACGMDAATHEAVPIGLTVMNLCDDCYETQQIIEKKRARRRRA